MLLWQAPSSVRSEVRAAPSHPRNSARSSLSSTCKVLFPARLTGFDEPTPWQSSQTWRVMVFTWFFERVHRDKNGQSRHVCGSDLYSRYPCRLVVRYFSSCFPGQMYTSRSALYLNCHL